MRLQYFKNYNLFFSHWEMQSPAESAHLSWWFYCFLLDVVEDIT